MLRSEARRAQKALRAAVRAAQGKDAPAAELLKQLVTFTKKMAPDAGGAARC